MIAGVILAAGQSKRMGSPKAFLKWGDSTFLETLADRLKEAGVTEIVAVVRPEALEEARALFASGAVQVVANADADERGPISSIRVALDHLADECWGILVCPVDHPTVERATFATLLQQANDNPGQIVVPVCEGKAGHPTLFPAEVFGDLRALPPGKGADAVVEEQSHRVVRVEVADPGVLRNIDTPDEYRQAIERRQP